MPFEVVSANIAFPADDKAIEHPKDNGFEGTIGPKLSLISAGELICTISDSSLKAHQASFLF